MTDYLLSASCISLVLLLTCKLLKYTPAVVRFYAIMLAIFTWFIPWQYVGVSAVNIADLNSYFDGAAPILDNLVVTGEPNAQSEQTLGTANETSTPFTFTLDFVWLFNTALLIGAIGFVATVFAYKAQLTSLSARAQKTQKHQYLAHGCKVLIAKVGTPAIATGLFTPTIWLDESMQESDALTSVLTHEVTHIRHKDTVWVWFLCLFSCLFWWNPVCWLLNKYARQFMELRCDEACYKQLNRRYQHDLASLTLRQYQSQSSFAFCQSPLLNVTQSKSFNVQRVKSLNKEKKMKAKHLVVLTAALSFSAIAASQIGSGTTQQSTETATQESANTSKYDAQITALLKGAQGAKSNDPQQLEEAAQFIKHWYAKRTPLQGFEEVDIKVKSFTLLDHVYHKLEQYQDILTAYQTWYPQADEAPAFLKNRLASAYLKLGKADLAIEQLQSLAEELDGKLEPGSAVNLGRAYIESGQYEQAVNTMSIASLEGIPYIDALKYYAYDKLNDQAQAQKFKRRLPEQYAVSPAILPPMMIPGSPLLAQL